MPAQCDTVTIWVQAFIPMPSVNAAGKCFVGDGRGFSSDYDEGRFRARSEIVVSGFASNSPQTSEFHQCGETHLLDCDTGAVLQVDTAGTEGLSFHGFHVGNTYPDPQGGVVDNPNELCVNFLYDGVTQNPLVVPSPDIDMALFFTIDPVDRAVWVRGAVNAFPDYEAYISIDGGPIAPLFQRAHSVDPFNGLPGGADQPVAASVAL